MSGRLPLYRGDATTQTAAACFQPKRQPGLVQPVWAGNAGLWYDKFCDCWSSDFSDVAKPEWVESVIHPRGTNGTPDRDKGTVQTGDPALLTEAARRRAALAQVLGGRCLDFILESRLLTGTGRSHPVKNGVAWHPTLGVPFLAGSGVKGLLRTWARLEGDADLVALFGPAAGDTLAVGAIAILDALPLAPVTLAAEILTPHTGPWNEVAPDGRSPKELKDAPADWHNPVPIPLLAVEAGARFQFILLPGPGAAPTGGSAQALDKCAAWLAEALRDLGAGAKTTSGYGRFRPANAPAPVDPDVTLPLRARPAGGSSKGGGMPSSRKRGTVDGREVEVRQLNGEKCFVVFLDNNETDEVPTSDVEF
ncbi:CRISPR-associated protein Cmr6 [Nitrospirillum amazonense]|uniref:CRISPR-associated protein Cmr6 n=1 Tax=Nitrospirillum amazonense TaxID=28077 RepID=A0A560EL13_9PROT|nr:type III-B CRISPR module RAMP protein Cmr6 [Nitrospirillum amazonense]TWB10068.1 CRISPR-associated protein Cmr6 [Nitrospirillum amazonense]